MSLPSCSCLQTEGVRGVAVAPPKGWPAFGQPRASLPLWILRLIFCAVLALGCGIPSARVQAQEPVFRRFTVDAGLAQSQVTSLMQDRDGYLWVGTVGGGISRFDGQRFETFDSVKGLPEGAVFKLVKDVDGLIYAATSAGLARFDGVEFQTLPPDARCGPTVFDMVLEAPRRLVLATDAGPCRYSAGKYVPIAAPEGSYRSVARDAHGALWFAVKGRGVVRLSAGVVEKLPFAGGAQVHTFQLLALRSGQVLVGTERGVWSLQGEALKPVVGLAALSTVAVRAMLEDREGRLWFGLADGVAWAQNLDGGGLERWGASAGFVKAPVRALLQDLEGSLWFGTDGAGLVQHPDVPFDRLGTASGLNHEVVLSMALDAQGQVVIGTEAGVARMEQGLARTLPASQGYPTGSVSALLVQEDGVLWAGGRSGLTRVSPTGHEPSRIFTRQDGLPDNRIFSLAQDAQGRLWVGTFTGAARLDGDRFVPAPILAPATSRPATDLTSAHKPAANVSIQRLLRDARGRLWAGGGHGIYLLEGDAFRQLSGEGLPADPNVQALLAEPDGSVWVALMKDGVLRLELDASGVLKVRQRVTAQRGLSQPGLSQPGVSQSGLFMATVVSLVKDGEGALWAGLLRGVDRIRFTPRGDVAGVDHFGYSQGFEGAECNSAASLRTSDGSLWFGTVKGIIHHHPRVGEGSLRPPAVSFRGLEVSSELERPPKRPGALRQALMPADLELPYHRNHVTVDFAAISLKAPEQVEVKYKLLPVDTDWVKRSGVRSATYANLAPGQYTFQLTASSMAEGLTAEQISFRFSIRPPFWQTDWFRGLAALVLLASLVGGIRLRDKKHQQARLHLERMVQARTRELAESNLELARLNLELERMAQTDGLTGLANHRTFQEELKKAWLEAVRRSAPLSMVMVDVDFFKKYNDTYGHPAGDRCLKQVAEVLASSTRHESDLPARYGGEEFAVLLRNTDHARAEEVAERLRSRVHELAIPHAGNPADGRVTISVGVATFSPEGLEGWGTLTSAADSALYRAKHGGRNRFYIYREQEDGPILAAVH